MKNKIFKINVGKTSLAQAKKSLKELMELYKEPISFDETSGKVLTK